MKEVQWKKVKQRWWTRWFDFFFLFFYLSLLHRFWTKSQTKMMDSLIWFFFCSFICLYCTDSEQIPWQCGEFIHPHSLSLYPSLYGHHFIYSGKVRSKQWRFELTWHKHPVKRQSSGQHHMAYALCMLRMLTDCILRMLTDCMLTDCMLTECMAYCRSSQATITKAFCDLSFVGGLQNLSRLLEALCRWGKSGHEPVFFKELIQVADSVDLFSPQVPSVSL